MKELFINIDGAARGNPGPSGIGVVIKDKENKIIAEINEYIGQATNNAAEYQALLRALEKADKMGANVLNIFSDSELMVKQYLGIYRTKDKKLVEFLNRAREIAKSFASIKIKHVPREQNKEADKLANIAINSAGD
ncbi:MAG: ribonuclease HI family protein [Elusimicrobiota bacterium]